MPAIWRRPSFGPLCAPRPLPRSLPFLLLLWMNTRPRSMAKPKFKSRSGGGLPIFLHYLRTTAAYFSLAFAPHWNGGHHVIQSSPPRDRRRPQTLTAAHGLSFPSSSYPVKKGLLLYLLLLLLRIHSFMPRSRYYILLSTY